MQFHSFFLPDFWGSSLVNNDYSGLNDDDEKSLHSLTEYWKDDLDLVLLTFQGMKMLVLKVIL